MTRHEITLLSPVKINLFLHITGQRADGYHLLQTLIQFLDYGDLISFSGNEDSLIERIDQHSFPLPDQDLCIRSAHMLREFVGQKHLGASITLSKKIPPGSGLGAGSSNAATTLLALNKIWNTNLNQEQLIELGRQLGADVPVFLHGESAWAEGIGDTFRAYYPEIRWYCVIIPGIEVPTAEVFADPHLNRDHKPVNFQQFIDGETTNDLEAVTVTRYPEVGAALDYLSDFGVARMSGTGSAVFVAVQTHKLAEELLKRMPRSFTGFAARSINHNPVLKQLSGS